MQIEYDVIIRPFAAGGVHVIKTSLPTIVVAGWLGCDGVVAASMVTIQLYELYPYAFLASTLKLQQFPLIKPVALQYVDDTPEAITIQIPVD